MLKGLKHSWSQVKMCPPILWKKSILPLLSLYFETKYNTAWLFLKNNFLHLMLNFDISGSKNLRGGGIRPFCWPSQYFFKIQELKGEGVFLAQIYLATHMGYVQKIFECEKQKAYKKSRPRWCSTFIYLRWIVKLRIKNRE